MAMLFMGGEDIDFDRRTGSTSFTTDTGLFRSNFARTALVITGSEMSQELINSASANFVTPSSNFWFSSQLYCRGDTAPVQWRTFLVLRDGQTKRLLLQTRNDGFLRVAKVADDETITELAVSSDSALNPFGLLHRLDMQVVYSGNGTGRIRVFINQVNFIDWTGNPTSNGSAALSRFTIGSITAASNSSNVWSEIMVSDRDTRTMSLKTHVPIATGTNHNWLGDQSDVNEIIADDSRMLTSDTIGQTAKLSVSPLPPGNFSVRAFKVSTWAARGTTAPGHIQLGVSTGGADGYGNDQLLDTGFAPASQIFDLNPVTNAPWTIGDIGVVQIAAKTKS